FVTARRRLPAPRTHTAADALFPVYLPLGGTNIAEIHFASILIDDLQQMRDFLREAAESRCIGPFDHLIDLPQDEAAHNRLMFFRRADGTAHQFDPDRLAFHYAFSEFSPRISCTAALSRNCSRALMVAFTTLCGLWLPIDLVSTLGIPQAC